VLFETYADHKTMLELYDRALEKQSGDGDSSARAKRSQERRAALVRRSDELELERKGCLRQNARGVLSDGDLDAMLAEVEEQREVVRAELKAVEDEAAVLRRIEAARESLAESSAWGARYAKYDQVHPEWYEDPDAVTPSEVFTLATSPEDIRSTYRKYGARFEVDKDGELTLRLSLGLGEPGVVRRLTCSS
jgi:hypothetical protein